MSLSALTSIFCAQSIAIIGASNNPNKRGCQAIQSLIKDGYEGKIFPINPKSPTILDIPAFKSVNEVEEHIDLALICTPAHMLVSIIEQCGMKNIPGAVVLGAGFGEAGPEGEMLQSEALEAAHQNNIKIVGPNTSGIFNLHNKMDLVGYTNLQPGPIGIASQSGNMALTLVTEGAGIPTIGFSSYVGVGNQMDLSFVDYLDYFSDDKNTKVLVTYVEGFQDGERFLNVSRNLSLRKPIITYKAGRTQAGQKAAISHTGALASSFEMTSDLLNQAGITVVTQSDKLLAVAETFMACPLPAGHNVCVLTDGGGHGTIAIDNLVEFGVGISELKEDTVLQLNAILPSMASLKNPIDVAGGSDEDPEVLAKCLEIIMADPGVDSVLMVGLFGGYGVRFAENLTTKEVAASEMIGNIVSWHKKPLVLQSVYAEEQTVPIRRLGELGIPVFKSIETSAYCLAKLSNYAKWVRQRQDIKLEKETDFDGTIDTRILKAIEEKRDILYEFEALELLKDNEIITPNFQVIKSGSAKEDLKKGSDDKALALKICSKDIVHKSDAGCVKLNVTGAEAIEQAIEQIHENAQSYMENPDIAGIIATPMADPGVEIIIGVIRDPLFGPVLMFGLGGIFVEVLKDVSFRSIPLTRHDASDMIDQIKSNQILQGVRGLPKANINALIELIMGISKMIELNPNITEIDLNPVIVNESGYQIVDARFAVSP